MGELGWELYPTTDMTGPIFDKLQNTGAKFGLRLAGYHALDSLRQEKGYRHWGHDITLGATVLEAGLGFALSKEKPIILVEMLSLSKLKRVLRDA